ncbi:uncharacterized protein [Argopecten irradians]|uniref:uncharacterized protein n=1 Tax=Argopecten irradians TaxID=31199 RepID=UPI0037100F75
MVFHIRILVVAGIISSIFCKKNSPFLVPMKGVLPFKHEKHTDFNYILNKMFGEKITRLRDMTKSHPSYSEKTIPVFPNFKSTRTYRHNEPTPAESSYTIKTPYDVDNRHLSQAGIERGKRHIYRSCCDCCRTEIVMLQLAPLTSNLTQIISVGACPDISRSRECRNCRCSLENRIYWILEETLVHEFPVVTPRYRFVPAEYPGHCIHANAG